MGWYALHQERASVDMGMNLQVTVQLAASQEGLSSMELVIN
jgi:hypothetical protein